jgi:hypothetical protein
VKFISFIYFYSYFNINIHIYCSKLLIYRADFVLDVHGKSGHTVHPQKHRAAWTSSDTQKTSRRVSESLNNTGKYRAVFKSSNNTLKTLCRVFKSSINNRETSRRVKNRHSEAATRSIRERSIGSFPLVYTYIHAWKRDEPQEMILK